MRGKRSLKREKDKRLETEDKEADDEVEVLCFFLTGWFSSWIEYKSLIKLSV